LTKIVCSVCNSEGLLQQIGKHYFRTRHYDGTSPDTHKPLFHYHVLTEDYVMKQLALFNQNLPSKARSNTKNYNSLTKPIAVLDLVKPEINIEQENKCLRSLARWGVTLVR
jgi:hypothetical protein